MPALGLLTAPVGWVVTDRLEEDDAFCVSCHLSEGVPLHEEKGADFARLPPQTLAAAHTLAGYEARAEDPAFRCIDCHGGTGAVGRLRVKLLSAKDAFWYVVGRFDEPERMHWPLWDADCRKCHESFEEGPVESWRDPEFHELSVHNVELGVACVECHLSHDLGGLADRDFLHPAHVRSQCIRCHPEFEEDPG